MNKVKLGLLAAVLTSAGGAYAEQMRLVVSIENLAPARGVFLTPVWVGFHAGTAAESEELPALGIFDTYDTGTSASNKPLFGSQAIERLAEDGNATFLAADFAAIVPNGIDATIPGPAGPVAPGDKAMQAFIIDSESAATRYFSYASMIIPSNDFFVSNADPVAHPIFDESGAFIAENFFIGQGRIRDAGTEVSDEIPANTAFLGQQAPNTGTSEDGLILPIDGTTVPGFFPADDPQSSILSNARFAEADFLEDGYPVARVTFAAAPAIIDDQLFRTRVDGSREVPAVQSNGFGFARFQLMEEGTLIQYDVAVNRTRGLTAMHLHLAPQGENGDVVVDLLPTDFSSRSFDPVPRIRGTIKTTDLIGALSGYPLDALVAEIHAGNIYLNVHTSRFPAGELRGQLSLPSNN